MSRYVAFLRAVNVGRRTVPMQQATQVLRDQGLADVSSYINSGNLLFTATGRSAQLQTTIRAALESAFGFEITTFVRTAPQVRDLAAAKPFGVIAPGHTHFALLTLTRLTPAERAAVEALSNDHDTVTVVGRDVHWLIRSSSLQTTLGPRAWQDALPGNPTTSRNTTMLGKLAARL